MIALPVSCASTSRRSGAVDNGAVVSSHTGVPYGTLPGSTAPLRRLVLAQDTGSAITGAVRADYFWGWGSEAEQQAGRMKQPLRLWVLWPSAGASALTSSR